MFENLQSLDGQNQEGNDLDSEGSIEDYEEGEDELNEEQIAALKASGYELGDDDDEEGEFDLDDEEAEYDDEDVEDEDDEDYDDEDDEPAAKRPKK